MLNNSEFNATKPIREFLRDGEFFDFSTLPNASKKYLECKILFKGEIHRSKMRLGYPPNKREARSWVFNLQKFVKPDDMVLMTHFDNEILVIPLNQDLDWIEFSSKLIGVVHLGGLGVKSLKDHQKRKEYKAYKKDYVKQAKQNAILGLQGESFVFAGEFQHLNDMDRPDLAEKIDLVSETKGDGLGYDILSFDLDENEKYIEVKTTKGACSTPFYMSSNEFAFAMQNTNCFYLYRVYEFNPLLKDGKIKIISANNLKLLKCNIHTYQFVVQE